jgi:hypothetical protein
MSDQEIGVNKDLEKVCSKVVELMNYGDWEKEYKRAKTVAETKVKSAQPTTRFYSLTFKESYLQALRQEATIEVSSSQNACQKLQTGVHRSEIQQGRCVFYLKQASSTYY